MLNGQYLVFLAYHSATSLLLFGPDVIQEHALHLVVTPLALGGVSEHSVSFNLWHLDVFSILLLCQVPKRSLMNLKESLSNSSHQYLLITNQMRKKKYKKYFQLRTLDTVAGASTSPSRRED